MKTGYLSYYRNRRVMVTGGLGFIGSNVVRQLVGAGQVVGGEVRPVRDRLHGEEHAVQPERRDDEELLLTERQSRPRSGAREVRQDQRQHRKRDDHGEVRVRALQVVLLFVKAQRAQQQCQAYQSIEYNHQHGEHGVARKAGVAVAGQDDIGDHGDLDGRDRHGQDQCAVGLAQGAGHDFGVPHCADGCNQDGGEQPAR